MNPIQARAIQILDFAEAQGWTPLETAEAITLMLAALDHESSPNPGGGEKQP